MTPTLPASSQKCRETRPAWAALLKRPSGRSRLLRDDPSTISSPATPAADPDKPGRPRSDRQPHNHSPPALTTARVRISVPCCHRQLRLRLSDCDSAVAQLRPTRSAAADRPKGKCGSPPRVRGSAARARYDQVSVTIRVLLADDSVAVRDVLVEILDRSPDIEVVGIADDEPTLLAAVEETRPDVVVTDVR